MLSVTCRWREGDQWSRLQGKVFNVSHLAAISDYDSAFDGRVAADESARVLRAYPRWAESSRGLVARCLALSAPVGTPPLWSAVWQEMVVEIALPGARNAQPRMLALATAQQIGEVTNGRQVLSVGWADLAPGAGLTGYSSRVMERAEGYPDPWALAEHVLRQGVFGQDALPACAALQVPVHRIERGLTYVREADIPEPARSEFARRMAHSTRPLIADESPAYYSWDWDAFINGGR